MFRFIQICWNDTTNENQDKLICVWFWNMRSNERFDRHIFFRIPYAKWRPFWSGVRASFEAPTESVVRSMFARWGKLGMISKTTDFAQIFLSTKIVPRMLQFQSFWNAPGEIRKEIVVGVIKTSNKAVLLFVSHSNIYKTESCRDDNFCRYWRFHWLSLWNQVLGEWMPVLYSASYSTMPCFTH